MARTVSETLNCPCCGKTVPCCADPVPRTLLCTISGGVGTITLTWEATALVPEGQWWVGQKDISALCPGTTLYVELWCDAAHQCPGTTWAVAIFCNPLNPLHIANCADVGWTCDPFSVTFSHPTIGNIGDPCPVGCDSFATVTITRVP